MSTVSIIYLGDVKTGKWKGERLIPTVNTVITTNKGNWARGWEGQRGKEAYTVHTANFISQWQCFAARYLSRYVCNVSGLHSICVCFLSTN